jgi:hypothetical protein
MNKSPRTPPDETPLLDAVLGDESWNALSDSIRTKALQAIQRRNRNRRVRVAVLQVICLLGVLSAVVFWPGGLAHRNQQHLSVLNVPKAELASDTGEQNLRTHFISEDQMMAMFPAGSCVLAEINGRKQLVFLDAASAKAKTW